MFVPSLLTPFDWSMALVAGVCYVACAIGIERVATYLRRRAELQRRNRIALRPGLPPPDDFFAAAWRRDRLVQVLLGRVKQIAPLFGLAGTVSGILLAFDSIQGDTVSVKEIGPAIALALKTTLFGALCASFCIVVSALPYEGLQDAEEACLNAMRRDGRSPHDATGEFPWPM